MKIKRDSLDTLMSNYIRARAGWKCERCGNMPDRRGLHCHHYHRRRKQSVRYDPDNCLSLCLGCHQFFGENRNEEEAFMLRKLGQRGLDMLNSRARTPARYLDREAIKIWLTQEIEKLKGENNG